MSLPSLSDRAFAWVSAPAGPALVCRALEPHARHLFTTRPWPLGAKGSSSAPDPDAGREDAPWADVPRALDASPERLVRLRQAHGASFVLAREASSSTKRPEADIVLTDRPDLVLAVQAADCVPLLLADRRTGAIAAVHAGWRGLEAQAPVRAVEALSTELGSRPADLIAAVGPSIGACCYEVGTDVRARFESAGFGAKRLDRWFAPRPRASTRNPPMPGLTSGARRGRWFFDTWAATRDELEGAGIPRASIHVAGLCTASHPAWLCSFRRDGAPAGRLAGAIRRLARP